MSDDHINENKLAYENGFREGRRHQFEKDINMIVDFAKAMRKRADGMGKRLLIPNKSKQSENKHEIDHMRACASIALHLKDALLEMNVKEFKPKENSLEQVPGSDSQV